MSMISGLIDKLRKSEQEWNQSNMFELAHMCHEAADTIWELRDDLQRANAENSRLRSELDSVGTAAYLYGRGDINDENAKLQKLVVILAACTSVDDCDKCPINGAEYKVNEVGCCYAARQRMRELGMEVDE